MSTRRVTVAAECLH